MTAVAVAYALDAGSSTTFHSGNDVPGVTAAEPKLNAEPCTEQQSSICSIKQTGGQSTSSGVDFADACCCMATPLMSVVRYS